MDRDIVLRHSKAIRLENKILPDFVVLLEELCRIKECPEYLPKLRQAISIPGLGSELIIKIIEYFEREYNIIKIERFPMKGNVSYKELLNII